MEDGEEKAFFGKILTLQASNLTSEDLSLTVLAPTSFTSPISSFLRFFEFTERVQTENAIQQRRSISNESSRRQSLGGADIILKLNGFFTTYYPSEATRATASYPHQYSGESQERRHVAICFVKTFRFKIVKNLTRNALNV
ncbi:hypothetical protein F2Q70_00007900 [Brassica cretica]|nr:hypothetical protein F2Q70_00007900 [Brassica cretica]